MVVDDEAEVDRFRPNDWPAAKEVEKRIEKVPETSHAPDPTHILKAWPNPMANRSDAGARAFTNPDKPCPYKSGRIFA
jgi:hypothetical protein